MISDKGWSRGCGKDVSVWTQSRMKQRTALKRLGSSHHNSALHRHIIIPSTSLRENVEIPCPPLFPLHSVRITRSPCPCRSCSPHYSCSEHTCIDPLSLISSAGVSFCLSTHSWLLHFTCFTPIFSFSGNRTEPETNTHRLLPPCSYCEATVARLSLFVHFGFLALHNERWTCSSRSDAITKFDVRCIEAESFVIDDIIENHLMPVKQTKMKSQNHIMRTKCK